MATRYDQLKNVVHSQTAGTRKRNPSGKTATAVRRGNGLGKKRSTNRAAAVAGTRQP